MIQAYVGIYANGIGIGVKSFIFNGGEVQVALENFNSTKQPITIKADLTNSDDVMALLLTVDAIRRLHGSKTPLHLHCPYLPYARQDRVMNVGESLGLKVMSDLINSLNFEQVHLWDVHSDVALATLNNVVHLEQQIFTQRIPVDWKNIVLVAPDAGALKKVYKTAKQHGSPVVRADKTRSVVDGSITGTTVYSEHVGDRSFLILDDICDGGRTFTELAKELQKLTNGNIYLYVTHGIFSNGFEPFEGLIDKIFVANPFPGVDLTNPLVHKLNLEY